MRDYRSKKFLNDMNDVASHIFGGRVQAWTNEMKVSQLTAMHNVLHKLTIMNWLPSSNTTIVTKDQAVLIYKLSCGAPLNIGQIIFERIWQEAESQVEGLFPIHLSFIKSSSLKDSGETYTSPSTDQVSPSKSQAAQNKR